MNVERDNRDLTRIDAKPPRWRVRLRTLKRMAMWYGFSKVLPLYLVTEFPKSGGTWFSMMLAECLGLPFARNNNAATFRSSVLQGTFLYSRRFHNVTVVHRDGRDIMVSAYYHFLFHNDANLPFGVEEKRRRLNFRDYDDIRTNLPRFIEYMFMEYPRRTTHCSWTQFVESWKDRSAVVVKYEDLLADAAGELKRVVLGLTGVELDPQNAAGVVRRYSFQQMTGRKRGESAAGSFIRKGVAGDWKQHFSTESRQAFDSFAGQHLIELGYESSHAWSACD